MLLILAALQEEVSGILRAGNASEIPTSRDFRAYSGKFDQGSPDAEFTAVITGTGPHRATEAADWAIHNVADPVLLVVGFAGGTNPSLGRGDLVVPTSISSIEGSPITWESQGMAKTLNPDPVMTTAARITAEVAGIDSATGLLVSLPSIARTANMKSWIGNRLNAEAVDLESHAVCSVASEAGVPFLVARTVVDAIDFDLPQLVTDIPGGSSDRRVWPAIRYVARRPWQLPAMMDLRDAARAARTNLTGFCREFTNQIHGVKSDRSGPGIAA